MNRINLNLNRIILNKSIIYRNQSNLAADYRTILKHLKKLPSKSLYESAKEQFDEGKLSYGNEAISRRATAHSYATTIASINELSYLRSLDTGEKMEQKELIESMTRRVGLSSPQTYEESMKREAEQKNGN